MSADAPSPGSPPPDRLLVRTCAGVVALAAAVVVAGQATVFLAGSREAALTEAALIAAGQATLSRQVVDGLDRIAGLEAGPEQRTAQAVLSWKLGQLIERDRRRAALAPPRGERASRQAERAALLQAATPADGGARAGAEVARLRTAFANEVVPEYELIAHSLEAEAAAARGRGRLALGAAVLAQLAVLAAGATLLVRRAAERTRAWIAAAAEAEAVARRRLLHDPITQLPNATYLEGYLGHLVADAARRPMEAAIIHVDLDRFEALREALGHRAAAEIIRIAGKRVEQCLRAGDFAAHLGQDDFIVVATNLADPNDAAIVAQRLHGTLTRPFSVRGGARRIGCSIGVTLLSDDVLEVERLLGNAEIALAQARQKGSGGIRYFCETMRAEVEQREMLCIEFTGGLERGEVVPYFQPQVALATGEFVGFEALARWHHPVRGRLSPRDFLDFAERADLTERLGEVILNQALEALEGWEAVGLAVPSIGVNIALAQLRDPAMIERIKWEVDRRNIDPGRLSIEVLETVLVKSDADLVVRNLRGLKAAGFRIDLDDFGTGHASICNLRRFVADRIKIDRSFVRGLDADAEQHKLVASMIAMARALGIRTLAEGVETAAEEAALRAIGCDEVQGFHLARPMDIGLATAWLAARARDGGGPAHPPAHPPDGDRITP